MRTSLVYALALLCSIKCCIADMIPTRKIDYSNYSESLGFSVNAMIHNESKDGLINYHVALKVPYNDFFGVTAALFSKEKVVARFSLPGVKIPYKKDDERMVFEFDCSPEEIANVVISFQIHPNEEKVSFIRLSLSGWPVSVVGDGKIVATVPVDQVRDTLTPNANK